MDATSRPAWGAWIEMPSMSIARISGFRRAPHGARGLKWLAERNGVFGGGRAPHGARGLKFVCELRLRLRRRSRPAWGAWIEMGNARGDDEDFRSRPAWGAWIEMEKLA